MPKKVASWGMQEYVPAGNGDPSGEYANDEGNNIHYFAKFAKPKSEIKQDASESNPAKKEEIKLEANTEPEKSVDKWEKEQKKAFKKIDPSLVKDILLNSYDDILDKKKVEKLSDKKAKELAIALNIVNAKSQIIANQQAETKEKAKEFLDSIPDDLKKSWTNIGWAHQLGAKDFNEFNDSLSKKIAFYNLQGEEDKAKKLIELKDTDKYKAWKESAEAPKPDFKKFDDLVSKYESSDSAYSQKRKDNAFWAKDFEEAYNKFAPSAKNKIEEWEAKDKSAIKAIKDYTGSYSSINHPLRSMDYPHKESYPEQSKAKQKSFLDHVNKITKVLDDSTNDFDCWVQRGVGQLNINGKNLQYDSSVDQLVGTTFKDQGFLSCGSGKGTGFTGKSITMNIYCPKGTKMLYVAPISNYKHENESIIQRGYSYKITKAEKDKNGHIYLDCEVILGSDATKWSDDELKEISKKHF